MSEQIENRSGKGKEEESATMEKEEKEWAARGRGVAQSGAVDAEIDRARGVTDREGGVKSADYYSGREAVFQELLGKLETKLGLAYFRSSEKK